MVLYENLETRRVTRFNAAYYKEAQERAFCSPAWGKSLEFKFGADVNRLIVAALVCDRREAIVGPRIADTCRHVEIAGKGIAAADCNAQLALARQRLRRGANVTLRIELNIRL